MLAATLSSRNLPSLVKEKSFPAGAGWPPPGARVSATSLNVNRVYPIVRTAAVFIGTRFAQESQRRTANMKRLLCTCLLGSALLMPVAMRADDDDHHRDRARSQRYWDPEARDWHDWNDHEQDAYRRYLREQNRQEHDWAKASKKEQREYWKWRHNHMDNDDHDRR